MGMKLKHTKLPLDAKQKNHTLDMFRYGKHIFGLRWTYPCMCEVWPTLELLIQNFPAANLLTIHGIKVREAFCNIHGGYKPDMDGHGNYNSLQGP